jgi:hypothetical protein
LWWRIWNNNWRVVALFCCGFHLWSKLPRYHN